MGAGIANWISFSNTTDIIHENSNVHWNCWWYDSMDLYWDRSPLAHINNAKTPVLIIHGDADDRVPISQGIEMYNALKSKGVYTQMVTYRRQPHGILEREAQIDFMKRTLEWYDLFLKK
jgi:dipeptidyl aminopeptidase/acylaminoacyl peptidase